jgi:hypothetical protein
MRANRFGQEEKMTDISQTELDKTGPFTLASDIEELESRTTEELEPRTASASGGNPAAGAALTVIGLMTIFSLS